MDHTENRNDAFAAAVVEILARERRANDMTYDELAERSGIPRASVVRYLSAVRDIPLRQIEPLAGAVGIDVVDLFERARIRAASVRASSAPEPVAPDADVDASDAPRHAGPGAGGTEATPHGPTIVAAGYRRSRSTAGRKKHLSN